MGRQCSCCRLGYDPGNTRQVFSDWDDQPEFPKPRMEELEASTNLFSLESAARPPSLLRNLREGRTTRLVGV